MGFGVVQYLLYQRGAARREQSLLVEGRLAFCGGSFFCCDVFFDSWGDGACGIGAASTLGLGGLICLFGAWVWG